MSYDAALLGFSLSMDNREYLKQLGITQKTTSKVFSELSDQASNFANRWEDITRNIRSAKSVGSSMALYATFTGIANAASAATSAVYDFTTGMERAQIATKYFVDGNNKAAQSIAYLRQMQQLAADTSFNTLGAVNLSQFMSSMGVNIRATKSVMTVINDTAAATNATEDKMSSIITALGQTLTKGRLAAEEVRQLANANIPVYEILKEQLNLSGSEIKNIGNYWIDANEAVVAILTGLEKRYKGAADEVAESTSGMVGAIQDNSLMISKIATSGIYDAAADKIRVVRDALQEYRDIAVNLGSASLFREILLDIDSTGQAGTAILALIGNVRELASAAGTLYTAARPLVDMFGQGLYYSISTLVIGFNAMSDVMGAIDEQLAKVNLRFADLLSVIASLYVTYRVAKAFGFLGQSVAAAIVHVDGLAMSLINVLPAAARASTGTKLFSLGLIGAASAAIYFSGALDTLINAMAGLTKSDGLPNSFEEQFSKYEAAMEEYNKAIKQYESSFDDSFESIAKAGNALFNVLTIKADKSAKKSSKSWLASFDEVYKIPEENDKNDKDPLSFPDLTALVDRLSHIFPAQIEAELVMPTFDWSKVYDTQTEGVASALESLLPAGIVAFSMAMAKAFKTTFEKDAKKRAEQSGTGKRPKSDADDTIDAIRKMTDKLDDFEELNKTQSELLSVVKGALVDGVDGSNVDRVQSYVKQLRDNEKKLNTLGAIVDGIPVDISKTIEVATNKIATYQLDELALAYDNKQAWLRENAHLKTTEAARWVQQKEAADSILAEMHKISKKVPGAITAASETTSRVLLTSAGLVDIQATTAKLDALFTKIGRAVISDAPTSETLKLTADATDLIARAKKTLKATELSIAETSLAKYTEHIDKVVQLDADLRKLRAKQADLQVAGALTDEAARSTAADEIRKLSNSVGEFKNFAQVKIADISINRLVDSVDKSVERIDNILAAAGRRIYPEIRDIAENTSVSAGALKQSRNVDAAQVALQTLYKEQKNLSSSLAREVKNIIKESFLQTVYAAPTTELTSSVVTRAIQNVSTQLQALALSSDDIAQLVDDVFSGASLMQLQESSIAIGDAVRDADKQITRQLKMLFSDSAPDIQQGLLQGFPLVEELGGYIESLENALRVGRLDTIAAFDALKITAASMSAAAAELTSQLKDTRLLKPSTFQTTLDSAGKPLAVTSPTIEKKLTSSAEAVVAAAQAGDPDEAIKGVLQELFGANTAVDKQLVTAIQETMQTTLSNAVGVLSNSARTLFRDFADTLAVVGYNDATAKLVTELSHVAFELGALQHAFNIPEESVVGIVDDAFQRITQGLRETFDVGLADIGEALTAGHITGARLPTVADFAELFAEHLEAAAQSMVLYGGAADEATTAFRTNMFDALNKLRDTGKRGRLTAETSTRFADFLQLAEEQIKTATLPTPAYMGSPNAVAAVLDTQAGVVEQTKAVLVAAYMRVHNDYAQISSILQQLTTYAQQAAHAPDPRLLYAQKAEALISTLDSSVQQVAKIQKQVVAREMFTSDGKLKSTRQLAVPLSPEAKQTYGVLRTSLLAGADTLAEKITSNATNNFSALTKTLPDKIFGNAAVPRFFKDSALFLAAGNISAYAEGYKAVGDTLADVIIGKMLPEVREAAGLTTGIETSYRRLFMQTIGEVLETYTGDRLRKISPTASGTTLYNTRTGTVAQIDHLMQDIFDETKAIAVEVKHTSRTFEFNKLQQLVRNEADQVADSVYSLSDALFNEAFKAYDRDAYYQAMGIATTLETDKVLLSITGLSEEMKTALITNVYEANKAKYSGRPLLVDGKQNKRLMSIMVNDMVPTLNRLQQQGLLDANTLNLLVPISKEQRDYIKFLSQQNRSLVMKVAQLAEESGNIANIVQQVSSTGEGYGAANYYRTVSALQTLPSVYTAEGATYAELSKRIRTLVEPIAHGNIYAISSAVAELSVIKEALISLVQTGSFGEDVRPYTVAGIPLKTNKYMFLGEQGAAAQYIKHIDKVVNAQTSVAIEIRDLRTQLPRILEEAYNTGMGILVPTSATDDSITLQTKLFGMANKIAELPIEGAADVAQSIRRIAESGIGLRELPALLQTVDRGFADAATYLKYLEGYTAIGTTANVSTAAATARIAADSLQTSLPNGVELPDETKKLIDDFTARSQAFDSVVDELLAQKVPDFEDLSKRATRVFEEAVDMGSAAAPRSIDDIAAAFAARMAEAGITGAPTGMHKLSGFSLRRWASGNILDSFAGDLRANKALTEQLTASLSDSFKLAAATGTSTNNIVSSALTETLFTSHGYTTTNVQRSFAAALDNLADTGVITANAAADMKKEISHVIGNLQTNIGGIDALNLNSILRNLDVSKEIASITKKQGAEAATQALDALYIAAAKDLDKFKDAASVSKIVQASVDELMATGLFKSRTAAMKQLSKQTGIPMASMKTLTSFDADAVSKLLKEGLAGTDGALTEAASKQIDIFIARYAAAIQDAPASGLGGAAKQLGRKAMTGASKAGSTALRFLTADVLGVGPIDAIFWGMDIAGAVGDQQAELDAYISSASAELSKATGLSAASAELALDKAGMTDILNDFNNNYSGVMQKIGLDLVMQVAGSILGSIAQGAITGAATTIGTGPGALIGGVIGAVASGIISAVAQGDGASSWFNKYGADTLEHVYESAAATQLRDAGYGTDSAARIGASIDTLSLQTVMSSVFDSKMARGESIFGGFTKQPLEELATMMFEEYGTAGEQAVGYSSVFGGITEYSNIARWFDKLNAEVEKLAPEDYAAAVGTDTYDDMRKKQAMRIWAQSGLIRQAAGTLPEDAAVDLAEITKQLSKGSDLYASKKTLEGLDDGLAYLEAVTGQKIDFYNLAPAEQQRIVDALTEVYKRISTAAARQVAQTQVTGLTGDYLAMSGGALLDALPTTFDTTELEDFYTSLGFANIAVSDYVSGLNEEVAEGLKLFGIESSSALETVQKNLTGWTLALPDTLVVSNLSAQDLSILASAGIQITADGVTFANAVSASDAGMERDMKITRSMLSDYEQTVLGGMGIGVDDSGKVLLDEKRLYDNLMSAMFTVRQGGFDNTSRTVGTLLTGYRDIVDGDTVVDREYVGEGIGRYSSETGMFEVTNKEILTGAKTISEWLAENDTQGILNEDIREDLLALQPYMGKNLFTAADAINLYSEFAKDDILGQKTQTGIGGVAFSSYGTGTVATVSNVSDKLEEGTVKLLTSDWEKLDTSVRDTLKSMGVVYDTDKLYTFIDVADTLSAGLKNDDLLQVYKVLGTELSTLTEAQQTYLRESGRLSEDGTIMTWAEQSGQSIVSMAGELTAYTSLVSPEMQRAFDELSAGNANMTGVLESNMVTFKELNREQVDNFTETAEQSMVPFSEIPDIMLYEMARAKGYTEAESLEIKNRTGKNYLALKDEVAGISITTAVETSFAGSEDVFKSELDKWQQALIDSKSGLSQSAAEVGIAVRTALEDSFKGLQTTQEALSKVQVKGDDGRWWGKQAATDKALEGDKEIYAKDGGYEVFYNKTHYQIAATSPEEALELLATFIGRDVGKGWRTENGGTVQGYQYGGLVNQQGLYQLGEGNRTEAVVPLENPVVSRRIGAAIAELVLASREFSKLSPLVGLQDGGLSTRLTRERQSAPAAPSIDEMADRLLQRVIPTLVANISQPTENDTRQPLYVGTLIASDDGLTELERRMQLIRATEERRL